MNADMLAPFTRAPERAAILLDFDGTLSEIVHVPDDARPVEGAAQVLHDLSARYAVVSVISGRSAHQLLEWLGDGLDIWGVHGAERVRGGRVVLSDIAAPYEELMERVRGEARAALDELDIAGTILEDKGVVLGLHFRAAADRERAREALDALAADLAERYGLLRAGGRLAFELRPPIDLTKRVVVEELVDASPVEAAMFIGDDRVDLGGYDALDTLAEQGAYTLRVAVHSAEAPAELLERADLIVDGPDAVVRLLQSL